MVGLVDAVGILAARCGELLEPFLDSRQRAELLGQDRGLGLERHDLIGVGCERRPHMFESRFDLGDPLGLKVVQQPELRCRAIGDALHFILAVDVGAKDASSPEGDVRRLPLGGQHDGVLPGGAADDVRQSVLGLDGHLDPTASQIAFDERFDPTPLDGLVFTYGQGIEGVANELKGRGLTGPPGADEAVQTIGQVEPCSVEKTANHSNPTDPMRCCVGTHGKSLPRQS